MQTPNAANADVERELAARSGKKSESAPSKSAARGGARADLKDVPILVVDDDAASAKLVSVVLGAEGCDVRVAASAEDASVVLRTFSPRVIVLDLILPLMSGLLFAERLKAELSTAGIVLIAVTAFNGPEAERVARQAGFVAYVRKPIDPLSFAQLVSDQLGGAA